MADFASADDLLPAYDVSDAVATVVEADREAAWRALLDTDLLEVGRVAGSSSASGPARRLHWGWSGSSGGR